MSWDFESWATNQSTAQHKTNWKSETLNFYKKLKMSAVTQETGSQDFQDKSHPTSDYLFMVNKHWSWICCYGNTKGPIQWFAWWMSVSVCAESDRLDLLICLWWRRFTRFKLILLWKREFWEKLSIFFRFRFSIFSVKWRNCFYFCEFIENVYFLGGGKLVFKYKINYSLILI